MQQSCCSAAREGQERGAVSGLPLLPGMLPVPLPLPAAFPGALEGTVGFGPPRPRRQRGSRAPALPGGGSGAVEAAGAGPGPAPSPGLRGSAPAAAGGRGRVPPHGTGPRSRGFPLAGGVPPALQKPETPTQSPASPCPRCLCDLTVRAVRMISVRTLCHAKRAQLMPLKQFMISGLLQHVLAYTWFL